MVLRWALALGVGRISRGEIVQVGRRLRSNSTLSRPIVDKNRRSRYEKIPRGAGSRGCLLFSSSSEVKSGKTETVRCAFANANRTYPPHDPQCAARRAWASPHGLPPPIPPIQKFSRPSFNPLKTLQFFRGVSSASAPHRPRRLTRARSHSPSPSPLPQVPLPNVFPRCYDDDLFRARCADGGRAGGE